MNIKELKTLLKWLKDNKIGYFRYGDEEMTWEYYDSTNTDVPLEALRNPTEQPTNEEGPISGPGRGLPRDEVDEETLQERIKYYSAD